MAALGSYARDFLEGPQEHVYDPLRMVQSLVRRANELDKGCEDFLTVATRGRGIIVPGAKLDDSAIGQLWFMVKPAAEKASESKPTGSPPAPAEPQPAPPDRARGSEGTDDLRDRERLILETMYANGVTSKKAKLTRAEIVQLIKPNDDVQSYAHAFADLKRKGYTDSNKGADAGIWLIEKGITAGKENQNGAQ